MFFPIFFYFRGQKPTFFIKNGFLRNNHQFRPLSCRISKKWKNTILTHLLANRYINLRKGILWQPIFTYFAPWFRKILALLPLMQHIFRMILGFFAQFLAKNDPKPPQRAIFLYDHLVYIYYLCYLPTGILFIDFWLANDFFQKMSTDPSQYLTPSCCRKKNVVAVFLPMFFCSQNALLGTRYWINLTLLCLLHICTFCLLLLINLFKMLFVIVSAL